MSVGNGIKNGRPKIELDAVLLIHLRHGCSLGWMRMAQEYRRQTGKWVSKETVKRRYEDAVNKVMGI